MLLDLARRGIALQGGSENDGGAGGGGADGGDGGDSKGDGGAPPADAEARASRAEAEAKKLRDEQRKRDDDERKAEIERKTQDHESAKRTAAEASERAAQAEREASQLRDVLKAQTAAKIDLLPEDQRERVRRYEEKLSLSDFNAFVEEEVKRLGSGDHSGGNNVDPPPPASGGVRRVRDTAGEGRPLSEKTYAILDEFGVDPTAARKMTVVEKSGETAKFTMEPKRLVRFMRERATQPVLLTPENYDKLIEKKGR